MSFTPSFTPSSFTFKQGTASEAADPLKAADFGSGAVFAYGQKLLKTGYSGNCLKVRRASDNGELDIGFVSDFIDTAAIGTFVGAGHGFITTFYDQIESVDAVNVTANQQPKIANSGEYQEPAYNGTSQNLQFNGAIAASLATTTAGTWMTWVNPVDATPSANEILISMGDTNGDTYMLFSMVVTTGKLRCLVVEGGTVAWDLTTDVSPFSNGVWAHVAIVQNGTASVLYVNGVAVAQTFDTTTDKTSWFNDIIGLDNARWGCLNYNSFGNVVEFDGNLDSMMIWNEALTAQNIADIYALGRTV